jgi:hypothetical protein
MKQDIRVVPPYNPNEGKGCLLRIIVFGWLIAAVAGLAWLFFWVRNLIK